MSTKQSELRKKETDPRLEALIQEFGEGADTKTKDTIRAITLLESKSQRVANQELFEENIILRKKCNELALELLKSGLRRSTFRAM